MSSSHDRTASLMTPAKLAQVSAGKAPASPTQFLDQMAADAGHQHVARLVQLCQQLQSQADGSEAATIRPGLLKFANALPTLDFQLLQARGLWASVTGKSRSAGTDFAAQFEQLEAGAKALAADLASVHKGQQPHAAASDRSLVELEVEYKALDRVIDQGARWLQDMRTQLKARQLEAGDDAAAQAKVREDAARCEILVARLKQLRAAAAAAQQGHQQVRATAQRRAAVSQAVQKALAQELKAWQSSVSKLAHAAAEGKAAGLNLEGPREAHEDLQKRLAQLLADCDQLGADEQALRSQLREMERQLAAVA